ncbi:MAG TPA: arylesterase [Thermoanaerobaculia bacterium]|jgi:acyl-CoA thioesterase-1
MTRTSFVLLLFSLLPACSDAPPPPPPAPEPAATAPAPPPADDLPLVVFLGDSLTAGLGLDEERAFPAVIGRRLAAEGTPIRVVNAGVSGDTTAGGLRRLRWLLRQQPDVVVVSLGGNDGLRAFDAEMSEENLRRIVVETRAAGARVLLTGMLVPPNYGPDYAESFRAIYPRLAAELDVPLVPFLLDGVGGNPELNQGDGIHPNAEGQERVAEIVLPYLKDVLAELTS